MSDWIRVTRQNPCPICKKPDWCMIGLKRIVCMRVDSPHECKTGGWYHPLDGETPVKKGQPRPEPPKINCGKLMDQWLAMTDPDWVRLFAKGLGVTFMSLWDLQVAWAAEYKAWAFPMSDSWGNWVGIRLRAPEGRKWAVTGSHEGIFLPAFEEPQARAWICEGPTDTAAGLSIGIYTIGRPSCQGGVTKLVGALRRNNCREAVILSDNDGPGADGARRLIAALHIPACILTVPAKDLRDYVRAGGRPEILNALADSTRWFQPQPRP